MVSYVATVLEVVNFLCEDGWEIYLPTTLSPP